MLFSPSITGKLYAGTSGVYFYGKKFFWDVNVLLTFRSIKQIQLLLTSDNSSKDGSKVTAVQSSKTRTLGVTILSKDGTVHDFCNMVNPHQVWAGLIVLQNENLTAIPQRQPSLLACDSAATASTSTASPKQQQPVRRTNSDPLMSTQFKRTESALSEICSQNDNSADDAAAATLPKDEPISSKKLAAVVSTTITSSLEQAWNETCSKITDYSNLVVDKQALYNCSLDTFVDLFVKDQADYSIAEYLQGRGDSELKETEWKTSSGDTDDHDKYGSNTANQTRTVHYMHPVNVPMAPPKAGARKEQTYCRFGEHGLVIETRTYVADVPMTDCFYVVDRIRVEPNYNHDRTSSKEYQESPTAAPPSPSVLVSMEFQITFVKSTMFRGIISKTTSSEFKSFFQNCK
jgi:hypothetical protein